MAAARKTTKTEVTLRDVLDFITEADDETRHTVNSFTVDCLKQSRKVAAAAVRAQVRVGGTIRLHGLRTPALNGLECEVVSKNRTRLVVRLPRDDAFYGKYVGGSQVTVPASACEVV